LVALLFHTVRHLKFRQLAEFAIQRVKPAIEQSDAFFRQAAPDVPLCRWELRSEFLAPGSQNNAIGDLLGGSFCFLGRTEAVAATLARVARSSSGG
jgi:hypothetical protein